jgi:hypothetical protein
MTPWKMLYVSIKKSHMSLISIKCNLKLWNTTIASTKSLKITSITTKKIHHEICNFEILHHEGCLWQNHRIHNTISKRCYFDMWILWFLMCHLTNLNALCYLKTTFAIMKFACYILQFYTINHENLYLKK